MATDYDGYKELAIAIVYQAIQDFRRDLKIVKQNGINAQAAKDNILKIVDFIKSEWFKTICDIEPEMLLKKLKEEVLM